MAVVDQYVQDVVVDWYVHVVHPCLSVEKKKDTEK